jgi:hypothetical protein
MEEDKELKKKQREGGFPLANMSIALLFGPPSSIVLIPPFLTNQKNGRNGKIRRKSSQQP